MSLYSGTVEQAASLRVRARARKANPELTAVQLDEIDEHVRKTWLPLVAGLHLDPHQIGELMHLVLHIEIERATGRLTEEKVKAWDQHVYADMRAHGLTNKQIGARLAESLERLRVEQPEAHAALERMYPLGHHPQSMRMLTAWNDRRKAEDDFKTRSAKARMTPVRGTLNSSRGLGQLGVTALRNLARSPLGDSQDAA